MERGKDSFSAVVASCFLEQDSKRVVVVGNARKLFGRGVSEEMDY